MHALYIRTRGLWRVQDAILIKWAVEGTGRPGLPTSLVPRPFFMRYTPRTQALFHALYASYTGPFSCMRYTRRICA